MPFFSGGSKVQGVPPINIDGSPCIIEEGESKAISFTLDRIPKWRECFTMASEATEANKKNTKNNQDMNFTEKKFTREVKWKGSFFPIFFL